MSSHLSLFLINNKKYAMTFAEDYLVKGHCLYKSLGLHSCFSVRKLSSVMATQGKLYHVNHYKPKSYVPNDFQLEVV